MPSQRGTAARAADESRLNPRFLVRGFNVEVEIKVWGGGDWNRHDLESLLRNMAMVIHTRGHLTVVTDDKGKPVMQIA